MIEIKSQMLTAETFAPYGYVTLSPPLGQRFYMDRQLVNQRTVAAKSSVSIVHIDARRERPMPLSVIERHEFSSQTFIAMDEGRYLVLVADRETNGSADLATLKAFIAMPGQSITYNANIWHGPMTPLDEPMRFAIVMFNDGVSGDEEVIRHDQPFATLTIE